MKKNLSFKDVCSENRGCFKLSDLSDEINELVKSFGQNLWSAHPDIKELCGILDDLDVLANEWSRLELINPDLYKHSESVWWHDECSYINDIFTEVLPYLKQQLNNFISQ